jgi:hypothetical protein
MNLALSVTKSFLAVRGYGLKFSGILSDRSSQVSSMV